MLHEILNRLIHYCTPILDNLQLSIASIEEHIFQGYERRMVKEILIVKRNITNFRRIMQVHQSVLNKLIKKGNYLFPLHNLELDFAELVETSGDVWDTLENLHRTIDALENTNNSLINFRLNDIIKILTTISVVILPVTLVASIFGMSLKHIPLADSPAAFWLILFLMLLIFSSFMLYFKKKQWL